jgi:cadmium resistance protein CadD (predicted permease)
MTVASPAKLSLSSLIPMFAKLTLANVTFASLTVAIRLTILLLLPPATLSKVASLVSDLVHP